MANFTLIEIGEQGLQAQRQVVCGIPPRALPVKPWLLGARGKGLCCMASWWSFVSWGEIEAEEDCESKREGARERSRAKNGKEKR